SMLRTIVRGLLQQGSRCQCFAKPVALTLHAFSIARMSPPLPICIVCIAPIYRCVRGVTAAMFAWLTYDINSAPFCVPLRVPAILTIHFARRRDIDAIQVILKRELINGRRIQGVWWTRQYRPARLSQWNGRNSDAQDLSVCRRPGG